MPRCQTPHAAGLRECVVPVHPMNRTDELRHLLQDSAARILLATRDLQALALPLLGKGNGPKGRECQSNCAAGGMLA